MGKVKIVSASAGSGKTYSLAYEYVRNVIATPSLYSHILAVTFTNKATEEMKRRILSGINDLACGAETDYRTDLMRDLGYTSETITSRAGEVRSKILHDYSHFSVLTIDKFFQRIIRAFLKEMGISVNFNLELPIESLLTVAADRLIKETSGNERLRRVMESLVGDKIDEGKSWDIRDEILRSGEEVFTESYKKSMGSPLSAEKLAFVVKLLTQEAEEAKKDIADTAAGILRLLDANSLATEDISGGNRGILSYIKKVAAGELKPYTESKSVGAILESGKWCKEKSPGRMRLESIEPELNRMLEDLCVKYDRGMSVINTASLVLRNHRNFMLMGDLKEKVTEISREENLVHITEINDMLSRLISGNDAPFIFEKAGNHFSHFMIDEFQDTSSMQWENFVPLLQNAVSQSDKSPVLLVGDVKQSIYRWRGGDWGILSEKAERQFTETQRSTLQTNYRSLPNVVNFINQSIGRCVAEESIRIDATLSGGLSKGFIDKKKYEDLTNAVRKAYSDYIQSPSEGKEGGYVTVTHYTKNEDGQAIPPVIEYIEDLQKRGYAAHEIAVLVRRNSEGARIAEMLLEHKKQNPGSPYRYDVITQDALIIGRSQVAAFILSCLRLSANADDSMALAQYNRFRNHDFLRKPEEIEKQFLSGLRLLSPEEAFESVVMRYGLSENTAELAYLQALHQQIISFSENNIADTPLFIQWWDEKGCLESVSLPTVSDAISIDTIHRSKGLGYKAVVIPYCNWSMNTRTDSLLWARAAGSSPAAEPGLFPVNYRKSMAESAFSEAYYSEYVMSHIDNLNLLYVAFTRAKEELHIMIPPPPDRGPARGGESIDKLICLAITEKEGKAYAGEMEGSVSDTPRGMKISFGSPVFTQPGNDKKAACRIPFTTIDIAHRVKLKLSAQRYFDDGVSDGRLAPRDYGILMHSVFEKASDMGDIGRNIRLLHETGSLTDEESAKLTEALSEAMSDELIGSWFDGSWDHVRNERDIIMPGEGDYRPDRVMIRGKEAVVVDYKFGSVEENKHLSQVSGYMNILSQMGYTAVSGYVWYIGLKKVVPARRSDHGIISRV